MHLKNTNKYLVKTVSNISSILSFCWSTASKHLEKTQCCKIIISRFCRGRLVRVCMSSCPAAAYMLENLLLSGSLRTIRLLSGSLRTIRTSSCYHWWDDGCWEDIGNPHVVRIFPELFRFGHPKPYYCSKMKRTLLLGKVLGFNSNREDALKCCALVDPSKAFIFSQTWNFLSSSSSSSYSEKKADPTGQWRERWLPEISQRRRSQV
jgi:hypothetical protein